MRARIRTFRGMILCAMIACLGIWSSVWGQGEGSIVPDGAEVKKLFGGLGFVEGPAADQTGNVFFTDIPRSRIHKVSVDGELSTFRENSGGANGLMFDAQNRLVACEGDNRRMTRTEADGSITVLAERFDNKLLNSPNDLTIAGDGGIYFTDPRYGNRSNMEQPVEGVYHIAPDGTITRVIDDLVRPNGILLTADNKTLYVMDNGTDEVFAYTVQPDGSLTEGRKLADVPGPDGLTMDVQGNLYITASTGIVVLSPEGEELTTIPVPEVPANCTFAGPEDRTLYITARTSLYSIRLNIPGQPRPSKQPTPVPAKTWGELKGKD